jgi:1,4-dihydroxy-2-naphthoate octaprenyltransferase
MRKRGWSLDLGMLLTLLIIRFLCRMAVVAWQDKHFDSAIFWVAVMVYLLINPFVLRWEWERRS